MAIPLAMFMPKRRWMQVSLRTLLAAVALLCVILSLWVVPAERQRRTVAAIQDMGGTVDYVPFLSLIEDSGASDPRESEAFPKTFLRRWLPPDYFDEVLIVLIQNTRLTDAKLAHLQGLTSMESLALDNTQNTDAGLARLQGLTNLEALGLDNTQVTDTGLVYLQGLTKLKMLDLSKTQVTDSGVANLRQALPKCKIVGP